MADSINLYRNSVGRISSTMRKKLLTAFGRANVHAVDKKAILKWLPAQAQVTSGSPIETAINDVHAITPLW